MNVVDASVSVKWVVEEPGWIEAREALTSEPALAAPALWRLEVANTLTRKHQEGGLSLDDVRERLEYLMRLPLAMHDDAPLLSAAVDLSLELRHPVCGCLYLALALREGGQVLTADRPFARAARRGGRADAVRLLIRPDQP